MPSARLNSPGPVPAEPKPPVQRGGGSTYRCDAIGRERDRDLAVGALVVTMVTLVPLRAHKTGALEQALSEYQKAFSLDSSNAMALQEIQRTSEMIQRNKSGKVKPDELNLTSTTSLPEESIR